MKSKSTNLNLFCIHCCEIYYLWNEHFERRLCFTEDVNVLSQLIEIENLAWKCLIWEISCSILLLWKKCNDPILTHGYCRKGCLIQTKIRKQTEALRQDLVNFWWWWLNIKWAMSNVLILEATSREKLSMSSIKSSNEVHMNSTLPPDQSTGVNMQSRQSKLTTPSQLISRVITNKFG